MSHENEYHALCRVVLEALHLVARHGDRLSKTQQEILVDTKKLLDAVAREKSDSASMRALVVANTKALQDISAQNQDMLKQIADLKAQIAAGGDVAALTQQIKDLQDVATAAQNDIDSAASDLSVDSDASEAALAANVQPQQGQASTGNQQGGQQSSGGVSAGSSSSSSSSAASDGGGVQKPSPLPGTGAPSSSSTDQASQQPSQPASIAEQSGIVDPAAIAPNAPPEDASAAGQVPLAAEPQKLGSDPGASKAPLSGA